MIFFKKLLTITAFSMSSFTALADTSAKPNIVYILADDLGYGDVQCLNPERGKIPTPKMDKLAEEGMVFTDAHSSSSVCTPTRYSILTGRYNWRTRLQRSVLFGFDQPLIAKDRLTVAGLLKEQGYNTAIIGKWHLGLGLKNPQGKATKGSKSEINGVDWKIAGSNLKKGHEVEVVEVKDLTLIVK